VKILVLLGLQKLNNSMQFPFCWRALAEAVATDIKGMSRVGQTIKGCAGEQVISKDLTPLIKGAIAGDNPRAVFTRSAQEVNLR